MRRMLDKGSGIPNQDISLAENLVNREKLNDAIEHAMDNDEKKKKIHMVY